MADAGFDVAVVGAGPAGAHLSFLLAERGFRVFLADRLPDLKANAFSSAGTTLDALDRFRLPSSLVGAFWGHLEASSSNEHGRWEGSHYRGAVLDFGRLRDHLAKKAVEAGVELGLGWRSRDFIGDRDATALSLDRGKEMLQVRAKVLVDATGAARSLMRRVAPPAPAYLLGAGLEWLVEVPMETWEPYRETLAFFLGSRWMPKGYSWIFPMEPGFLKVGAGRFSPGRPEEAASLKGRIGLLTREVLGDPPMKIRDVHGGVLRYARGLSDPYHAGRVIAVGDAVSTLNTLGGEGIRHAMEGAEIALPFIIGELADPGRGFPGYRAAMHSRFKRRWDWSEELAVRRYLEDGDERLDAMIRFLRGRSLDFVVDVLFRYNFPRAARAAGPAYLWSRLRRAGRRIGSTLARMS